MPKKRDRAHRKRVLVRQLWARREAELREKTAGWYHAFGGEVPDMATDEQGVSGPAWQSLVMGPSAFDADSTGPNPQDAEPIREKTIPGMKDAPLRWLGTWTHYPSVDELDDVTPEQYRASSGARTEPLGEPHA